MIDLGDKQYNVASRMLNIKGKLVSEDTIHTALKDYINK